MQHNESMDLRKVVIRSETKADYSRIAAVNDVAFGQSNESLLIEKLRSSSDFIPELSLVAELNNGVIGHLLLYPIAINDGSVRYRSLALAPMCVHPHYQRKGIGSKMVTEGLKRAATMGYGSVIVVGHPDYYPRFGFKQARAFDITAPFDVPENAFLVLELKEKALESVKGVVEYPKPFSEV